MARKDRAKKVKKARTTRTESRPLEGFVLARTVAVAEVLTGRLASRSHRHQPTLQKIEDGSVVFIDRERVQLVPALRQLIANHTYGNVLPPLLALARHRGLAIGDANVELEKKYLAKNPRAELHLTVPELLTVDGSRSHDGLD